MDQVPDSRPWSALRNLNRLRYDSPALLDYIGRHVSFSLEILDLAFDVPCTYSIKPLRIHNFEVFDFPLQTTSFATSTTFIDSNISHCANSSTLHHSSLRLWRLSRSSVSFVPIPSFLLLPHPLLETLIFAPSHSHLLLDTRIGR